MSSIARVIFFVDWTDRIRRRTTRSWAPIYAVGASSPLVACFVSSTDDMRSQPTSGFTSSGGVVSPSAASEPGPVCVGTNVVLERRRSRAFSVASVSSDRSPVSRIAAKTSGLRVSRYVANSSTKRFASSTG